MSIETGPADLVERDIDTIALEVARRFTQDTEPQRRASLQVAITEAIRLATPTLREPAEASPNGYAYRYPDGYIRHTGGKEVNGSKPVQAIPYFYGRPPTAPAPPAALNEPFGNSEELQAAIARMNECRAGCDAGDPFYADAHAWGRNPKSRRPCPGSREAGWRCGAGITAM